MAGQLKEVRNRIKSVQSTQQITKAMKMVSAAKLRRAQDAIIQMRPYAQKLQELLSNIVSNSEGEVGMSLATERAVEKVLLIVITSDRGLAGAFNANVIKLAKATIAERYDDQYKKGHVAIWNIGKKGYEHFIKNNYKADATHKDIFRLRSISLAFSLALSIAVILAPCSEAFESNTALYNCVLRIFGISSVTSSSFEGS